jgi:hypothetical protein
MNSYAFTAPVSDWLTYGNSIIENNPYVIPKNQNLTTALAAISHSREWYPPRYKYLNPLPTVNDTKTMLRGYMACLTYMDKLIGEVVDAVQVNKDIAQNTIMVLTSFTGTHLGESGGHFGTKSNYERALRVPLMFTAPMLSEVGKSASSYAELVDVAPTLVDLVEQSTRDKFGRRIKSRLKHRLFGVEWRSQFDGISLADAILHNASSLLKQRAYSQIGKTIEYVHEAHDPYNLSAKQGVFGMGYTVRVRDAAEYGSRYTRWYQGNSTVHSVQEVYRYRENGNAEAPQGLAGRWQEYDKYSHIVDSSVDEYATIDDYLPDYYTQPIRTTEVPAWHMLLGELYGVSNDVQGGAPKLYPLCHGLS